MREGMCVCEVPGEVRPAAVNGVHLRCVRREQLRRWAAGGRRGNEHLQVGSPKITQEPYIGTYPLILGDGDLQVGLPVGEDGRAGLLFIILLLLLFLLLLIIIIIIIIIITMIIIIWYQSERTAEPGDESVEPLEKV